MIDLDQGLITTIARTPQNKVVYAKSDSDLSVVGWIGGDKGDGYLALPLPIWGEWPCKIKRPSKVLDGFSLLTCVSLDILVIFLSILVHSVSSEHPTQAVWYRRCLSISLYLYLLNWIEFSWFSNLERKEKKRQFLENMAPKQIRLITLGFQIRHFLCPQICVHSSHSIFQNR